MYPGYYNKPDRCPKCGSSDVERKHQAGSSMEYDFGRDWYECHSCNFEEDVNIDWAGGAGLPKSDWWSLTKYPVSWWEDSIKNMIAESEIHEEAISECKRVSSHATDMIKRLTK